MRRSSLALGLAFALVLVPVGADQIGRAIAGSMGDRAAPQAPAAAAAAPSAFAAVQEDEPGFEDFMEGVGEDPVVAPRPLASGGPPPPQEAARDPGPPRGPARGPGGPAPPPDPAPPDGPAPPVPTLDLACNGIDPGEALSNGGQGDPNPAFQDLTWAVLKTGFRFAAAWTSADEHAGSLLYRLGSGPVLGPVTEGTTGRHHLLFLEGLPIGETLEFRVGVDRDGDGLFAPGDASAVHKVVLCNAQNGYSARAGHHLVNLAVLANEEPSHSTLEHGLDVFAIKASDATDGWVRAGIVLMVYNDPLSVNAGRTCASGMRCGMYDVVFADLEATFITWPPPAANAQLDGITAAGGQIVMRQMFEAPPGSMPGQASYEVGSVLLHEFGHYGFGMMDQYDPTGTGLVPDCWSATQSLSVMGAMREATEFDDSTSRCPNENARANAGFGYMPSWDDLVARYPMIPDRGALRRLPDPGPLEAGPGYLLLVMDMGESQVPAPS